MAKYLEADVHGDSICAVDRRALPLLLAADDLASEREREPLDRLRLQKGVFIMQMSGSPDWQDQYRFKAWDWGPFSRDLATEVTKLVRDGYLEIEPVPGRRHPRYRATARGQEAIARLRAQMDPKQVDYIRRVHAYVTSRSFSQLLREVYSRFPEYAVRSRFQG